MSTYWFILLSAILQYVYIFVMSLCVQIFHILLIIITEWWKFLIIYNFMRTRQLMFCVVLLFLSTAHGKWTHCEGHLEINVHYATFKGVTCVFLHLTPTEFPPWRSGSMKCTTTSWQWLYPRMGHLLHPVQRTVDVWMSQHCYCTCARLPFLQLSPIHKDNKGLAHRRNKNKLYHMLKLLDSSNEPQWTVLWLVRQQCMTSVVHSQWRCTEVQLRAKAYLLWWTLGNNQH